MATAGYHKSRRGTAPAATSLQGCDRDSDLAAVAQLDTRNRSTGLESTTAESTANRGIAGTVPGVALGRMIAESGRQVRSERGLAPGAVLGSAFVENGSCLATSSCGGRVLARAAALRWLLAPRRPWVPRMTCRSFRHSVERRLLAKVAGWEVCRDLGPIVDAVECCLWKLERCLEETRLAVVDVLVYALVAAGVEGSPILEGLLVTLSDPAVPVCWMEMATRPWDLKATAAVLLACFPVVHQVLHSDYQGAPTLSSSLPPASRPWVACRSR